VVSSDVTSVLLSWRPPRPAHGIITGYSVGYYRSSDGQPATDDDMTVIVVGRPSPLHYNVTGLRPYTTYKLQVLLTYLFIMVALCNRADHYIFILFLSSSFFFFLFFSSPNLSSR